MIPCLQIPPRVALRAFVTGMIEGAGFVTAIVFWLYSAGASS